MTRKLAATGIAVIVAIPLIPLLVRGIGHLTGTDAPMIFPTDGWKVAKRAPNRAAASAHSSTDRIFVVDQSASMTRFRTGDTLMISKALLDRVAAHRYLYLLTDGLPDYPDREVPSWSRIRNAYQGGDLLMLPWYVDANPARSLSYAYDALGNRIAGSDRLTLERFHAGEDMLLSGLNHYSPLSEAYLQQFAPLNRGFGSASADGDGDGVRDWSSGFLYSRDSGRTWADTMWDASNTWRPRRDSETGLNITVESPKTHGPGTAIKGRCRDAGECSRVYVMLKPSDATSGTTATAPDGRWSFQPSRREVDRAIVNGSTRASRTAPVIHGISPDSSGTSGFTLTITGAGFQAGTTVQLSASSGTVPYQWSLAPPNLSSSHVVIFPISVDVDYLEQYATQGSALPLESSLTSPDTWALAAATYAQLEQEWPRDAAQIDSLTLNATELNTLLADSVKSAGETNKGDTNPAVPRPQRVAETGWYSLDLVERSAARSLIDLEFVGDNGERQRFSLEGSGGQRAAWMHFNQPGALTVRASGAGPALRGLGFAELVSRSRDMTLAKAELTVFLLCEVLPLTAWILTVCLLRAIAYCVIRKLPRTVRSRATHEVDTMLTFAKWAGVGCYLIWTVKDVLAGVGIVFVT